MRVSNHSLSTLLAGRVISSKAPLSFSLAIADTYEVLQCKCMQHFGGFVRAYVYGVLVVPHAAARVACFGPVCMRAFLRDNSYRISNGHETKLGVRGLQYVQ